MSTSPNIAELASLIGEPSRVMMLVSLLGGKALPASELAQSAKVTPQTASTHLGKLVEGGLLTSESHGRHRYYRLASPEVAHALEALLTISAPQPVRSLRESDQMRAIRYARTCYDHLAGEVGVALTQKLIALGMIEASGQDFVLNEAGKSKLRSLGVEVESSPKSRRRFARQCLDWSERRHHLAGSLGASLTNRLFELGWIERIPGGRAVRVTPKGTSGFIAEFGLDVTGEKERV
ncbi:MULTISPECIES: helix-turn-helix transcriptional regulator [Brevibacillus]|jgi:DNA-binding transcriptional ArsR family regulator|uniref:Transcriptional regulator n=1 Tax=Brevibacillus parabrevis TaxID=54914 RepID=A0A4Y3PMK5_BREPA|nr:MULTISPECIES: metalloregulator ArsR/SmtB family transcription factor [Brevibacillus]MBU8714178.1 metalloregulator ArsR/SmtB family transcription factor [Brevibacillus parabrevis]MDH6350368.1 DNA-binding transcriptional ArsR family regulator [Brevibacillus sp. 1238]MDR5001818.1 metalloregulator ArsR/SmtB family transcription factor [Brevibacillus parabrevis]MED2253440.1 metalloregulator ArsR/SmtB family transcription factor [Brevibacillus parabrevis]NRQ55765.1 helix-turn-helix transcriptiona